MHILGSLNEIFKEHIYKFQTTKKEITIIDCGANIGLATLFFKMNFPDSKVIAFEPDPNIFRVLTENIKSQGLNNVSIRNEAVSIKDANIYFYLEGGHSGMIVKEKTNERVVQVKSIRFKNMLQQLGEITFLKIDIEGHEKYVIPDISDELKKVQFLFLEYHSFINENQNLDEILKIINCAGFKYYIKESFSKPIPFINREIFLNMDLLLNIFCYREE